MGLAQAAFQSRPKRRLRVETGAPARLARRVSRATRRRQADRSTGLPCGLGRRSSMPLLPVVVEILHGDRALQVQVAIENLIDDIGLRRQ